MPAQLAGASTYRGSLPQSVGAVVLAELVSTGAPSNIICAYSPASMAAPPPGYPAGKADAGASAAHKNCVKYCTTFWLSASSGPERAPSKACVQRCWLTPPAPAQALRHRDTQAAMTRRAFSAVRARA